MGNDKAYAGHGSRTKTERTSKAETRVNARAKGDKSTGNNANANAGRGSHMKTERITKTETRVNVRAKGDKSNEDNGYAGRGRHTKNSKSSKTETHITVRAKGDKYTGDNAAAEKGKQPDSGSDKDSIKYPSTTKLVLILCAIILAILLVALDTAIVSTAIPAITDDFHSLQDVGWYGSGYFMTLAVFQSAWGRAYKLWSIKIVYLLSMFIFEGGSLLCAVAPTSTALIIGRAIAGVGGGGIAAGSYLIIGLSAPPDKTPALQGLVGAAFAVASIAGPLLGGVFTEYVSWRWCFYINLPLGGVTAILVVIFYHDPAHVKPISTSLKEKVLLMDPLGTMFLLGGFTCLFVALQKGGVTDAWDSKVVLFTLVGTFLFFGFFIAVERWLGERASFQGRFLNDKTMLFQLVFQTLVAGCFFVLLYYLPIYFQAVKDVSPAQSGVYTIPLVGLGSISVMAVGVWLMSTGDYQPAMLVGTVFATVGSGLIYTFEPDISTAKWVGYQLVAGIGVGMVWQLAVMVCQGFSSVEDMSTISALALFFQLAGGAIWISVSQSVFSNRLVKALERNVPGVPAQLIVGAGATELRKVLQDPEQIRAGVESYMEGLRSTFALSVGLGGTGFLVALISVFFDRRKMPKTGGAAMG